MAKLRKLMLDKKIKQRQAQLEEMKTKLNLEEREAELSAALEEANTDEEVTTVEESIATLEEEKTAYEEEKGKLETEIENLERELEDLDKKEPEQGQQRSAEPEQTKIQIRGGNDTMKVNKGFFKGMERSAVTAIVEREDVKKFLEDLRERNIPKDNVKRRAVEGAEYNIPDVVLGLLRDNLHRYSKLISKVNLKPLKGTGRLNVVGDIPEAIWTEACATLNELDIKFHQIEVDGYKVGGYVAICNATLEDSDINLANEVFDILGQAIGLAVDKAIVYGTGVKMPVGIVTRLAEIAQPAYWGTREGAWTNLSATNVGQVTGATPQEKFAELVRFSGKAKANYGNGEKFWVMNENTYTELQADLVSFNAAGAIVSAMNNTMPVVGGEVITLPFMADGDIVGGYGSHYLLAERSGSSFASSEHVQFIEDNTVYKGTARYDGRPIKGEGFVAMNISGVAPTTSVAFAPDTANEEVVTP